MNWYDLFGWRRGATIGSAATDFLVSPPNRLLALGRARTMRCVSAMHAGMGALAACIVAICGAVAASDRLVLYVKGYDCDITQTKRSRAASHTAEDASSKQNTQIPIVINAMVEGI